jgi:ribosomal protein S6--L-glutamate ligase
MKIIILSRGPANYTTRRLKDVAEARGHEVRIINYGKCYMTVEKGNPVVYYGREKIIDVDAIIPRIAQSYTRLSGNSRCREYIRLQALLPLCVHAIN